MEFKEFQQVALAVDIPENNSLEESDDLPDPEFQVQEIVEDLESNLEQFREIAMDWEPKKANHRGSRRIH